MEQANIPVVLKCPSAVLIGRHVSVKFTHGKCDNLVSKAKSAMTRVPMSYSQFMSSDPELAIFWSCFYEYITPFSRLPKTKLGEASARQV